jgi:hypothetical protein
VLAPAALCVVLVATRDAAAAKPEGPYKISAGALVKRDKHTPPPPMVTVSKTYLKGLTVTIEYADGARRADYLKSLGPKVADPFATPSGARERALTFLVTFENKTALPVVFQPGNVALVSDKNDQGFPLDISDMYMSAERAGVEDLQQVLDRSTSLIFDSSTTIPSGAGMTRLLAFRPIEGKWKQFQVHFSYIQIGAETHTLTFTFHKEPIGG